MYVYYRINLFLFYIFKEIDLSVVIKIYYSSVSEIWKIVNVFKNL